jgi:O-antigen chain-terminating methyltransferase
VDQLEYYTFMGYPGEVLKERYQPYADRFSAGNRVLDIGCGRGEFLEVLRDRGIEPFGVDADAQMAEEGRGKGLSIADGDAIEYLHQHAGEFDGTFAAHIAEHLSPEALLELVKGMSVAVKPGGRVIVVTPNPRNLLMQLNDFWIDLQHVRFYSPDIMRWVLNLGGLEEIEIGVNPRYRLGPEMFHDGGPEHLPRRRQRSTGLGRLQEAGTPSSLLERLAAVEERLNQLSGWASSLYPPGEYFATGVRPA